LIGPGKITIEGKGLALVKNIANAKLPTALCRIPEGQKFQVSFLISCYVHVYNFIHV
jgi:hypothetical protein